MKSKKLIELLQKEDPSGEVEVCIGNCDIWYLDRMPAYYDGRLQTVTFADEDRTVGTVVKAKYHSSGDKINIRIIPISEAICHVVEANHYGEAKDLFEIDYSELHPDTAKSYKESNQKTFQQMVNIYENIEKNLFKEWVKEEVNKLYPESEGYEWVAEAFYEEHLNHSIPIPEDLSLPQKDGDKTFYLSYTQRRKKQWSRQLRILCNGMDFSIMKREVELQPEQVEERKEGSGTLMQSIKRLFKRRK